MRGEVKVSEGLRAPITHPHGLSIKVFPAFSVRGEGYLILSFQKSDLSPYGLNADLLPAVGLTLPYCRPYSREESDG